MGLVWCAYLSNAARMVLDLFFGSAASSAVCIVVERVHETTALMRKGLNLRGARVLRGVVMVGSKASKRLSI